MVVFRRVDWRTTACWSWRTSSEVSGACLPSSAAVLEADEEHDDTYRGGRGDNVEIVSDQWKGRRIRVQSGTAWLRV